MSKRLIEFGFLSTLSLRRATVAPVLAVGRAGYFYPRSPCGERPRAHPSSQAKPQFLSTLSLRRATEQKDGTQQNGQKFLSTLSLRRATKISNQCKIDQKNFYPRSPCGERPGLGVGLYLVTDISIHALLAESDTASGFLIGSRSQFLSTLSLRRATISCAWSASKLGDFYPRSPCGERPR